MRVPAQGWDAASTVVVLEVKGKPESEPKPITQGSDSPFHLDYPGLRDRGPGDEEVQP